MTKQPLIEDVANWLQTKHTTLWGGHWSVTSGDTCKQAAEWFCTQVADFNQWNSCEDCETDLLDEMTSALASVIGKYVPPSEHGIHSDLFSKYIAHKDGTDV